MRLAFDIETDGLLRGLTKIHCIVARDIDSDQEYRWDNGDIKKGLQFLLTPEFICSQQKLEAFLDDCR